MYKPKFNHVLVEINTEAEKWGRNEDSLGGESYREGKVIELGDYFVVPEAPELDIESLSSAVQELKGKEIMWNEGTEAGTVFEHEGKKYALIYWHNIIGVKDGE